MNVFRKFFITLLFLTSLNLTQNFAMEPDPNEDQNLTPEEQVEKEQFDLARKRCRQSKKDGAHKRTRTSHDDDDEESDDDSDSVSIVPETPLELQGKESEPVEKKIILECEDTESKITLEISKDIANQSLMLGSIYKESGESFLDVSKITNPDSIFILHKLMKLANQIAQSQNTIDLKIIIQALHNDIYKTFDTEQINDFKNIADYFQIPLIQEAIEDSDDNSPFGLIIHGFIPLSIVNKIFGLDPKSLDFYTIEKNIKTHKQFCELIASQIYKQPDLSSFIDNFPEEISFVYKIYDNIETDDNSETYNFKFFLCEQISNLLLSNTDDKFYLSNFLDQVSSIFFEKYLYDKITLILRNTKINEHFNLTPDLKILLSPKIFLRLLLVLSEEDLEPLENLEPFLGKLSLLVTNNRLVNYDLALAQALLVTNNHREKNSILRNLNINIEEFNADIQHAKSPIHILDLRNRNLNNTWDLSKLLFYIAVADILKVKRLNLSNNQLTDLPIELFGLINLKTFDCDNNNLTKIPTQIGNLVNLRVLSFLNNKFKELPQEILNLRKTIIMLNLLSDNATFLSDPNSIEIIRQLRLGNYIVLTK
ncbi:leucine-rich repeat domain-containing protein [Candidatus Babeliales bacterium]|nr:leucine-rich repeat domain-containing protein [Candidatus Babeliales bacterium]